jgi:tetratricopeptide (TPR) repeat protein
MNRTSHKTIWTITGFFVLMACIVLSIRSQPLESDDFTDAQVLAIVERDRRVAEMKTLLETDWRIRRSQTRAVVESVSRYAQHPILQSEESFFALGLVRMYKLSDPDGAERALRQAIDFNPEWSWSHDLLGVVLYSKGDVDGGLASLNRAMELDPGWSRPHSDMAILFRLDENWEMALKHAAVAMKMDPVHPIPYYNYGVILYKMGDLELAQEQFKHVLELNSNLPAPYYNIACGYARNGQLQECLEYLLVSIKLDPDFYEEALRDSDFDSIRGEPLFIDFLDRHHP